MKKINTNIVQFTGKIEIPEELDEDKSLLVMGEFDFNDVKYKPTEDGEYDRTYNVSPIRLEVRSGELRLIGKPKKRGSQRLRGALWHEYQKLQTTVEYEDWYDQIINKIIVGLPEVISFLA